MTRCKNCERILTAYEEGHFYYLEKKKKVYLCEDCNKKSWVKPRGKK